GSHLGGAHGGAPAGGHAAAHEAGDLEGDVVVDAHARVLGHDRVLRERAERAEAAEVLAVLVEAEGLVLQAADAGIPARVAQVLVPGRSAPRAPWAGRAVAPSSPTSRRAGGEPPPRSSCSPSLLAPHGLVVKVRS